MVFSNSIHSDDTCDTFSGKMIEISKAVKILGRESGENI